MMKYILILLGAAVLFTLLNRPTSSDPSTASLHASAKILAFGDSLTYGFGAAPKESYPSVLARKSGLEVINAGINGETSEEGLRRLPALLHDREIKLMILCFGGNDILQKLPLSKLKANLIEMIRMAKERGVAVLLISLPDIGLFGLSPLALYEEAADETDTPLLSGVLADILSSPALKSDQIHPNAAGYRQLAERIYERVRSEGWIR